MDAVANQIKNTLGINAEGDSYPTFSDIRDRVTDRTIATAFRSGWMLDYPSAEDYLTPLYSSASADGHGSNDGDYKSPKFDQELADALSQTDESKRTAALQEAQETLLQRTLPHRSAALAAYMNGRCAADSLPRIRSTPAIHVICRNTGGNQPCTLPPCALRYPKFIISLL